MIVSCPECRTLYRHRPTSRRAARCGACHAEIALPRARTYLLQTVSRATRSVIARAQEPSPVLVASAVPSASSAAGWTTPARVERRVATSAPWEEPGASPFEADDREQASESAIDRRLTEIARRARAAEVADDATVRNVLFGVGVGAIAGVAFSPGLFDASWVSWAVGGTMGGLAAALWSRAWGLRRA